jgi:hypothetical protein
MVLAFAGDSTITKFFVIPFPSTDPGVAPCCGRRQIALFVPELVPEFMPEIILELSCDSLRRHRLDAAKRRFTG